MNLLLLMEEILHQESSVQSLPLRYLGYLTIVRDLLHEH